MCGNKNVYSKYPWLFIIFRVFITSLHHCLQTTRQICMWCSIIYDRTHEQKLKKHTKMLLLLLLLRSSIEAGTGLEYHEVMTVFLLTFPVPITFSSLALRHPYIFLVCLPVNVVVVVGFFFSRTSLIWLQVTSLYSQLLNM